MMRPLRMVSGVALALLVLAQPAAIAAEDAARLVENGNALLAKGDFEGALREYVAAAREEPANEGYRQRAALLQRVIRLRAGLDEVEGEAWLARAESLHAFYVENGVLGEALALAARAWEKARTGEAANRLARTQLAAGRDADALALLGELEASKLNPDGKALLGLAQARSGRAEAAKAAIEGLASAEDASAQLLFDLACVRARTGEHAEALALLVRSFEQTPPSRLDAAKAQVGKCEDLAAVRGDAGYEKALATVSKVAESKCSTGTSCGSCPSRTPSCPGVDKDKEKAEGAKPEGHCPPGSDADGGSKK